MRRELKIAAIMAVFATWSDVTLAQSDTILTYQGELKESGGLANGSFDMDFALWDALSGGAQIGGTESFGGVTVSDGRFTVELDFGANAFDNSGRWLEIDVNGITLTPRTPITRSPYSIQTRGIFVDADNKVGIGTSAPDHLLHVVGDPGNSHAIYGRNTGAANGSAGVFGESNSANGYGLFGLGTHNTGANYGVYGQANSSSGVGIYGWAAASSGGTHGVIGRSNSDNGTGVYGWASSNSGASTAIYGRCDSTSGFAGRFDGRGYFTGNVGFGTGGPQYPVHAQGGIVPAIFGTSGTSTGIVGEGVWGVEGSSTDPDGRGLFGFGASISGTNYGVYGLTASQNGRGVYGYATNTSGSNYGVHGESASSAGRGVYGYASDLAGVNHGVHGESDSVLGRGVVGYAASSTGTTQGVRGEAESPDGTGVVGVNNAVTGNAFGVYGESGSPAGAGVHGIATPDVGPCVGVFGKSNSPDGFDFLAGGAGEDYGTLSSIRWKRRIEPISNPIGKLSQIRGVSFDWDETHGGTNDVGFIAEEVGQVLPEIVQYEENGIDAIGMDYSKMTPLLVEAVNELHAEKDAEITELHTRIADLERLVERLITNAPEHQPSGN